MSSRLRTQGLVFGPYAAFKNYRSGVGAGGYHCDGGPSAVFMALTVSGERCLEVEAVNPTTCAIEKRIRIFANRGTFVLAVLRASGIG